MTVVELKRQYPAGLRVAVKAHGQGWVQRTNQKGQIFVRLQSSGQVRPFLPEEVSTDSGVGVLGETCPVLRKRS